MAVSKHVVQTKRHDPAEQPIDQRAARKLVLDPIRLKRFAANCFEFVPVNPPCERPVDLFVYEKPVLLIGRVQRNLTRPT